VQLLGKGNVQPAVYHLAGLFPMGRCTSRLNPRTLFAGFLPKL
jgi:hypothetical protein